MARAGKGLFVTALAESPKCQVHATSIVDPVKERAKLCGWAGGKSDKDREFLSDLLILLMSYNGLPLKQTVQLVEKCQVPDYSLREDDVEHIVTIDCRQPEFIDAFKEYFEIKGIPCRTILIRREEAEQDIPDNMADRGVFDYRYDLHVWNDGTEEEFKENIKQLILGVLENA